MSEYIFDVPDGNQPIAGDSSIYYPDERDEPMTMREEIVRCMDCTGLVETWGGWECERYSGEYHSAEPDGFCAWGERREP